MSITFSVQLSASHIHEAEITYTHLTGNDYLVSYSHFRNCGSLVTPIVQQIVIESANCGISFTESMVQVSVSSVPGVCASLSDCIGSTYNEYEEIRHEVVVTLPANCADWIISNAICCRSSSSTNLTNPSINDIFIFARLNNSNPNFNNNSPQFEIPQVVTAFVGQEIRINLGIFEADGDSLVFDLVPALADLNQPVAYNPPFSGSSPFLSSTPTTINSSTGEVTFTPSGPQVSVACINVEEYRNGIKLGEVRRDFLIWVYNIPGNTNTSPIVSGVNGTADATGISGPFVTYIPPDSTLCFDLTTFDAQGDTIIMASVVPTGATFSLAGNTGTFCWTPTVTDIGTHLFTLSYNDDVCPYAALNSNVYEIIVPSFGQHITGTVAIDSSLNCMVELTENPLESWRVDLLGATQISTYTDQTGSYYFDVDIGSYAVVLNPPIPLWSSCQASYPVVLSAGVPVVQDIPVQVVSECPYLSIDLSAPFLRICSSSNYHVNYCNSGTGEATNAYLEIEFDADLIVNSSSLPWSSQSGNVYTFQLGNVPAGTCENFFVNVTVDCDSAVLGQTHCVEAHIYPDSLCFPPDPIWDGSITKLTASCGLDSLSFSIKNTGTGGMAAPLDYYILEDSLIIKMDQFQLGIGAEKILKVPSNGSTYRLYAEQAAGYFPVGYLPTVAVEGCGGNGAVGILNNFNEDDILPSVSIDCQENIGPFDPNDKRAQPEGYGPEHYIEQNVDLDYHIRFQNVGTDTAFNVVILDTLSSFLDVPSLRQGVSSHPYQLDIINNQILKFTFNNIQLVDSTTNEPGSHGFIKFTIAQNNNLPLGTIINNRAAIYFDFNDPVITNETFHEIGEDFIPIEIISTTQEVVDFPELQIEVLPNPFTAYTDFRFKGIREGVKTFQLIDVNGKVVYQDDFSGNEYRLFRQELSSGVFFYSIFSADQILGSGKLIVN